MLFIISIIMAMFNFLKKKEKPEEESEVNEESHTPTPQTVSTMPTELPEFPTAVEEEVTPLPTLSTIKDFSKQDIEIPSIEQEHLEKPTIHPEKNITPKVDEVKEKVKEQKKEKKIELPPMLKEEIKKEKYVPEKSNTLERKSVQVEKSIFVNIKDYKEVLRNMNLVESIIKESERVIVKLDKIKIDEDNELKILQNSLDGLHKKIIFVDDILIRRGI